MKVARLHGAGDLRLHDEALPVPGPGDVLVRVSAVGLCGSDLHWFSEAGIGDAKLTRPLVLGHELAGVIESGPQSGQRVAVEPSIPCGACEFCHEGHPNLCPHQRFAGHNLEDGALREYMAWPSTCLFPLPDALSDAEGVMLEPLGVAIHSVDLAHLKPAASVGIFGCGPIGLLVLQVARLAGAVQLFATDKPSAAHRLQVARALGASAVFGAAGGQEATEIWAATGQRGVDVAFEVAGDNEAVEAAIAAVRPGGKVILIGIPPDDRTAFDASVARRKGLTIKMVRRMKHTYPRAIRLVEQGLVNVRSLVSHTFPLADCDKAFSLAHKREGLKVIVKP
ncbi:MAG: alcohol dehydrogenase catalytic domain-containing protein [Thermoflexales bacterium]|nr:alcohol dehydrogenase catalytic domain-containing protein [Thermoflexales bacterium]